MISCPNCKKLLPLTEKHLGRRIVCPFCKVPSLFGEVEMVPLRSFPLPQFKPGTTTGSWLVYYPDAGGWLCDQAADLDWHGCYNIVSIRVTEAGEVIVTAPPQEYNEVRGRQIIDPPADLHKVEFRGQLPGPGPWDGSKVDIRCVAPGGEIIEVEAAQDCRVPKGWKPAEAKHG